MATCRKCGKSSITCPSCRGVEKKGPLGDALHCSTCDNKRIVCPDHGPYNL